MGLGTKDTFIIDPSHKGPCIAYMAKSDTGAGTVWFKIFEDGYDQSKKSWCVDKLRANMGRYDVPIPTDITPGNYLFRFELIALHEGDRIGGAQPYVGCSELTVGGSGTVNPGNLVAIPGVYTATDPGIHFDIYTSKNPPYPIPGPPKYVSGSPAPTPSPTPSPVTTAKATSTSTSRSSTSTSTSRSSTSTSSTSMHSSTSTSTSTSSSTSSSSTGSDAMCYLPGTPNLNGKTNGHPGSCGKKAPRARCADNQCCSQWGYCGPVPRKDGTYYESVDGKNKVVSEAFAYQLYCNKTQADYRKVPCNSIQGGIQSNEELGDKQTGSSNSLVDISYLRSLMVIGVSLSFVLGYLF